MQNSGISSLATISASRPPEGPPRSRFALTGRSTAIDPRIDAARRDLADVRLAARIFAPHYAAAVSSAAVAPASIYAATGADAEPISQILTGERFETLEMTTDYAWGICAADGVVGYVPMTALGDVIVASHVVSAVVAPVYAERDTESAVLWTVPMGARFDTVIDGQFAAVPGGYLAASALRNVNDTVADHAAVAEALVGVPYRKGGRSGDGVDASGLVFLTLEMAGFVAPRFLDLQAETLGRALDADQPGKRGDLIYFADHAAILASPDTAIHVGSTVTREALAAIVESDRFGPVIARRRVA